MFIVLFAIVATPFILLGRLMFTLLRWTVQLLCGIALICMLISIAGWLGTHREVFWTALSNATVAFVVLFTASILFVLARTHAVVACVPQRSVRNR